MAHVNYCSVVYLHGCNKKLFQQLESRFVDCGRTLLFHRAGSSRSMTLQTLNWLPLKQHLFVQMALFIFKIYYLKCPVVLYNMLQHPTHEYSTRQASYNFNLPHILTKQGKKAFVFWAPYI